MILIHALFGRNFFHGNAVFNKELGNLVGLYRKRLKEIAEEMLLESSWLSLRVFSSKEFVSLSVQI